MRLAVPVAQFLPLPLSSCATLLVVCLLSFSAVQVGQQHSGRETKTEKGSRGKGHAAA